MSCNDVLSNMKATMKENDLLPQLYSEPHCQGEVLSICTGQYNLPFTVRSMIIPFTFSLDLIDSAHRWISMLDHELHGEVVEDTEEIIEQWLNDAETHTFYQSWSEANAVRVEQGNMSYYDMVKHKCQETSDIQWCQYVEEGDADEASQGSWSWLVILILIITCLVFLLHVQKNNSWTNLHHSTRNT